MVQLGASTDIQSKFWVLYQLSSVGFCSAAPHIKPSRWGNYFLYLLICFLHHKRPKWTKNTPHSLKCTRHPTILASSFFSIYVPPKHPILSFHLLHFLFSFCTICQNVFWKRHSIREKIILCVPDYVIWNYVNVILEKPIFHWSMMFYGKFYP